MNIVSTQPLSDFEQHQLEMLLWHAQIHERNGKKQEASQVMDWVADFLSPQSFEIEINDAKSFQNESPLSICDNPAF
jgi:hypothetical protein